MLISSIISYQNLSKEHRTFSIRITTSIEPESYEQTSKHKCWTEVMERELLAMEQNDTYWVKLSKGRKSIGSL